MSKTMTKYQLDHFRDKVKRQFNPMIDEQELLVKQFKTEATDKAVISVRSITIAGPLGRFSSYCE